MTRLHRSAPALLALATALFVLPAPAMAQMAEVDSFTAAMSEGRSYGETAALSTASGAFGFTADRLVQLGVMDAGCDAASGADAAWNCSWNAEARSTGVDSRSSFLSSPAVQDAALGRYLQQTWHALGVEVQDRCRAGDKAPGTGALSVSACIAAADLIGPVALRSFLDSGDCPQEVAAAMTGGADACRQAVAVRLDNTGGYAHQGLSSYEIDLPVSTFTQLVAVQESAHAQGATTGTGTTATTGTGTAASGGQFAENSQGCSVQNWEALQQASVSGVEDAVGRRQAMVTAPTSVLDGSCFDIDDFMETRNVSVLYDPATTLNGIIDGLKDRVCDEASQMVSAALSRTVRANDFFTPMGFQIPSISSANGSASEVLYSGGYEQCTQACMADSANQPTEAGCQTLCMQDPAVSVSNMPEAVIQRVSRSLPTISIVPPVR